MINQKMKLVSLVALFVSGGIASACLWDRDTITDELQTRATQYDLVMGQFPSHGEAYYLKRIEKLEASAGKNPLLWNESNDLAVAYIRTKQFSKALLILNKNHETKAEDYHTLSNLGVLYKKQGNYADAADYMRKALEIKPEGHMGLGDWYLKRLEWSKENESKSGMKPELNFLGEKYSALNLEFPWAKKNKDEDDLRAKYLTKLIKNDRHFSDGYLVMGDLLLRLGDLHLAMRCYQHAQHLKHPNPDELEQRIDSIIYHWANKSYSANYNVPDLEKRRATQKKTFLAELEKTEQWLSSFHAAESLLVERGETPDFSLTAKENQTKRFSPITKPGS